MEVDEITNNEPELFIKLKFLEKQLEQKKWREYNFINLFSYYN